MGPPPDGKTRAPGSLSAAGLAVTGGEGFTTPATDTPVSSTPALVAATGKLPAGTYYVTATALLVIAPGDSHGTCWIARASDPTIMINLGGAGQEGEYQAAETAAVTVAAGDSLQELCDTAGTNGSLAADAGIVAIRVLSSSHP